MSLLQGVRNLRCMGDYAWGMLGISKIRNWFPSLIGIPKRWRLTILRKNSIKIATLGRKLWEIPQLSWSENLEELPMSYHVSCATAYARLTRSWVYLTRTLRSRVSCSHHSICLRSSTFLHERYALKYVSREQVAEAIKLSRANV